MPDGLFVELVPDEGDNPRYKVTMVEADQATVTELDERSVRALRDKLNALLEEKP